MGNPKTIHRDLQYMTLCAIIGILLAIVAVYMAAKHPVKWKWLALIIGLIGVYLTVLDLWPDRILALWRILFPGSSPPCYDWCRSH